MSHVHFLVAVGLGAAVATLSVRAAAATDVPTVESADVLVAVLRLEGDIETVRRYMGKPKSAPFAFRVQVAQVRHSFYQAQSLFRKLNSLGQEVAGMPQLSAPVAPDREIVPADVLRVVERSHDQLALVKQAFGIADTAATPRRVPGTQSREVLEALVRALQQANLMLVRRYLPQDVFERMDLATVYVAGVLAGQGKVAYPQIEFVPYKQPIEVFRKLLDCMELSARIGDVVKLPVLQIDVRRMRSSETQMSTNYDLATMLLTDIAFWSDAMSVAEDVYPEAVSLPHIVPSHVFQKASQLEAQLQAVLEGFAD